MSYNLLAASIKRQAFTQYDKNIIDDEYFNNELNKAKKVYSSIFEINKNYYPAINIIYLQMILAYRKNEGRELAVDEAKSIWKGSDITKELTTNDWWSYISNIEFLIIIEEYELALLKLKDYVSNLKEKEEIDDFSIASTIRQLKLYNNFNQNKKFTECISILEDIENKKHNSKHLKK